VLAYEVATPPLGSFVWTTFFVGSNRLYLAFIRFHPISITHPKTFSAKGESLLWQNN